MFTDPNVAKLLPMKTVSPPALNDTGKLIDCEQALASLGSQPDLPYEVYDRVVAEPTEASWRDAIAWARGHDFSHFLA